MSNFLSPQNFSRTWRRPSAFLTIGEGNENEDEQFNEFDSDEDFEGGGKSSRKVSFALSTYSSNSSLDSEGELAFEMSRNRRESIIPNKSGLQNWVELTDEKRSSSLEAFPKKRKYNYEDIKEMILSRRIKEAKTCVRSSDWDIGEEIRSRLWPLLDSIHETNRTTIDGFYWETVKQIFGSTDLPNDDIDLSGFIPKEHRHYYNLSNEGKKIADRIVSVIGYSYPDITYCPLLLPLSSLFLHYTEEEKTYECLSSLLSARNKVFLTQTKLQWEVLNLTAMHLTKKYSKSTFVFITKNLKENEKPETIFQDWIWWIFRDLPVQHLMRIVDCYLFEGVKVLYRVGIAIINSFSKSCNSDTDISNQLKSLGFNGAISYYCRNIKMNSQRLLKSAFAIRAFRSSEIRKISLKNELDLKNSGGSSGNKFNRLNSSDNMPSSQSQMDIQMLSHTLAIKELLTLWSWLPQRITMYTPILLYTTEEHGSSLTTFYKRVENYEPTILLVKTISNHVFGAYCSTDWAARNEKDERGDRQRYFGTGETFLFSLYPERVKYPWIGIKSQAIRSGQDENNVKMNHAAELFMHADSHMVTVGGGEGTGIYLDEELRFGKTETCQTFNNPPLVPEKDFEIRVLEVFGFESN